MAAVLCSPAKTLTRFQTILMSCSQNSRMIAYKRYGATLPAELLASVKRNKVALKGPVTTPIGEGFTSVNVGAAQGARSLLEPAAGANLPGVETRFQDVDLVIVRENTEDLYAGPRARDRAGHRREPEDHHREGLDPDRAVRLRATRAPTGASA